MTEEQINHALRRRYGFPQDTIDDPDREPEQVILDELQAGPSWLDCLCACGRCITARHRLLLSGQIEPDPHGWRLSKTCEKSDACGTLSAEASPTKPKE